MSGTGDSASQEIEASTSSNSTRNSMKCTFVQSILKTANSQIDCSSGRNVIFGRERVPELPMLEKNDFIQNWIIAHSSLADSPEKSCPESPILGHSSVKRSPQSPILGYQWKRIKREAGSKENCRVSLNKKFQHVKHKPLVTARTTIEHEIPRYSEPGIFLCANNDVDKTLTSVNSPVLNKITNSPTLNTSRRSCQFGATKSPSRFDADSTLKWNDHKSLVRDSTEIPETLSLSSPLCKRNNPFKIVDASNYPKQTIEAVNKQLLKYSELLAEESPNDVEVISSSSKIPETLSHSTIDDEFGELKVDPKKSDLARYDLQANEDVTKFERLHRSPSSANSIKIEAETSSEHDRLSRGSESSNSSVRLSISSRFRKKKLIGSKSYNASCIRAKTSPVKLEALETLPGFDHVKKNQESSPIPDTLSVSSQLRESLVPESSNTPYQLSIPSPLKKKKVIVSSPLVESLLPDSADSPDRLFIPSPLRRQKIIDIKSNNTYSIRAKNSFVKSEATGNLCGSDRSKKYCDSPQIPDTLSVTSQLLESLVPESSDSPDRLMNHSLLRQNKFIGLNSNDTSWIRSKNSCVKSEVVGLLRESLQSKKIRESLQIEDTLSVSSQLDEIVVPESSNSPDLSSLSASLGKMTHLGKTSANPPIMRIKNSPMKFEIVASANCNKHLIEIGESFKVSNTFSERIDVESSTTNALEDDIKIESDSDCTISDFIENPTTQNSAAFGKFSRSAKSAKLEERPQDLDDRICKTREDRSCDSDETYYSDGDSIPRLQITKASPLKNSQQISEATSQSHESRVISQAASPLRNSNCQPPWSVMPPRTTNNNNNKKKKGKKGSLVAKLQTIVNSQVSKLRIWRYQMSQPDFKNSLTQFVKLKVRERETRYGRHYLTTSVIEDSHDLLKSIFESESNLPCEKGRGRFDISIVTLMMVPEIIGVVKMPAQSTLKIYPPWEIMDRSRKILNVIFFNVGAPEEANVDNEAVIKRGSKNIIQDFECPCIRAKKLVDSCRVKFSNTKTGVMQAMFSS